MSVVSIPGNCFLVASCASGTLATPFFGVHCFAPAGLVVNSHSLLKSVVKYLLLHCVGVEFHVTSNPEVMASFPFPVLKSLFQPSPCSSIPAPSGAAPTCDAFPAPCVFPKVCPPAISATVSSSFIPILPNVSRMSFAEANGSGFPFGPSGLT